MTSAIEQLRGILSDTEGRFWGRQRDMYAQIGKSLSDEHGEAAISLVFAELAQCERDHVEYVVHGYALVALLLARLPQDERTETEYARLFDDVSRITDDVHRVLAITGNWAWPGVVEYSPTHTPVGLESFYRHCFEIVESGSTASSYGSHLSQFALVLGKETSSETTRKALGQVALEVQRLTDQSSKRDALVGLVEALALRSQDEWGADLLKELLARYADEPPEYEGDHSPREGALGALFAGLAQNPTGTAKPLGELAFRMIPKLTPSEQVHIAAPLAAWFKGETDPVDRGQALNGLRQLIKALKKDSAKAEAIAKAVDALADPPFNEHVWSVIRELENDALSIRDEDARKEALADTVTSVATAFVKIADVRVFDELRSLVDAAKRFRATDTRAEYLSNLSEILTEHPHPDALGPLFESILAGIVQIKDSDEVSNALSTFAESVAKLEKLPNRPSLLESALTAASRLRDREARLFALVDIGEALAKAGWFSLHLDVLHRILELAGKGDEKHQALVVHYFGKDVLSAIPDEPVVTQFATELLARARALKRGDTRSFALKGLIEGLIDNDVVVHSSRTLIDAALADLDKDSDDERIAHVAAGMVAGVCGAERPASKVIAKYLVERAVDLAGRIRSDIYKSALLSARSLDLGVDEKSVAFALGELADETWKDIYDKTKNAIRTLTLPVARLGAFCWFLESAVGHDELKKELHNTDWVRELYLECLREVARDLRERDQWDDDDRGHVFPWVAQRLYFLRTALFPGAKAERPLPAELFLELLQLSNNFEVEPHAERDVIRDGFRFIVRPRAALIASLATDLGTLDETRFQEVVSALLEVAATIPDASEQQAIVETAIQSCVETAASRSRVKLLLGRIIEGIDSKRLDPAVRLQVARGFGMLADDEAAIAAALQLSDPAVRLQALRELTVSLKKGETVLVRETLAQLVGVETALAGIGSHYGDPEDKDVNPNSYHYDVAVSYATPDRAHALALAAAFKQHGLVVFEYSDPVRQAELWGQDGYKTLYDVFRSQALFCVILVSRHFVERKWTLRELEAAQARQFESKEPYILAVKLDNTELPGESPQRIYQNLDETSYDQIASLLARRVTTHRLGRGRHSPEDQTQRDARMS